MIERKARRRCEHCSRVFTVGEGIAYEAIAYASEIQNDYTKHWLCEDCQDNSRVQI